MKHRRGVMLVVDPFANLYVIRGSANKLGGSIMGHSISLS